MGQAFDSKKAEAFILGPDQNLDVVTLLQHAAKFNSSDLLITADSPPIVRHDGELYPLMRSPMTAAETQQLVYSVLTESQKKIFEEKKELDFSLTFMGRLRFRANIYRQKGAVAGAFRIVRKEIPSLEDLGVPIIMRSLSMIPQGLILVTGPTGSGKTTTTASIIDYINKNRRCHIVTVEDPIEFVHENKLGVVDQREVYSDTLSFANALKYILRETPDVIFVGEMRDPETVAAALTAAETGHLVIATLHTNDAVQAIDRIVDFFPPQQTSQIRIQLSFVLLGIVAQQLIPKTGGSGRILATEVLINNHAIATHIREGKTHQTKGAMEGFREQGMITMDGRLLELYAQKLIPEEELIRRLSLKTRAQTAKKLAAKDNN